MRFRAVIAVSLVLLLLGACGDSQGSPDDSVALPDRVDPIDPGDASRSDGAPVDAATGDAATDAGGDGGAVLHVFATSTTSGANLGGLAGADLVCKNLAVTAGLGGTWAAWLSNNPAGPHAINRVTSAGPWHLVTGEVVAQTKAELGSGTLRHAIDRDEKGVAIAAASRVWTGTGPNGMYLTNDCDKWTTGANGRVGLTSAVDATWTSAGVDGCGQPRRLYCFQL